MVIGRKVVELTTRGYLQMKVSGSTAGTWKMLGQEWKKGPRKEQSAALAESSQLFYHPKHAREHAYRLGGD